MTVKIIGALLILIGCSSFGLVMVFNHRREVFAMEQLLVALEYMQSELQYRLTPLPELTKKIADITKGVVQVLFDKVAAQLEMQVYPDPKRCVYAALEQMNDIPRTTYACVEDLARTLGMFDLEGQRRSLDGLIHKCHRKLDEQTKNQETRLRCYKTLSICIGAALAILFV